MLARKMSHNLLQFRVNHLILHNENSCPVLLEYLQKLVCNWYKNFINQFLEILKVKQLRVYYFHLMLNGAVNGTMDSLLSELVHEKLKNALC